MPKPLHLQSEIRSKLFHFSVDDVFESLIQVSDSGGRLFQHPFFAFLSQLHQQFDINIDLYLFGEGQVGSRQRTLAEVSDRLRDDLLAAPWLRFGPHALNYSKKPFEQTVAELSETIDGIYSQIDRLGGYCAHAQWLRLHYFAESYEVTRLLKARGVQSLLLTDRSAAAYRLDPEQIQLLRETGVIDHCALQLRRSYRRVEQLVEQQMGKEALRHDFDRRLDQHGYVALFTHEIEMLRPDVQNQTALCLELLTSLGAQSR